MAHLFCTPLDSVNTSEETSTLPKASHTNLNLVNLNVKSSWESDSLEVLLGEPGDWKKEKHILVQPNQSQAI